MTREELLTPKYVSTSNDVYCRFETGDIFEFYKKDDQGNSYINRNTEFIYYCELFPDKFKKQE